MEIIYCSDSTHVQFPALVMCDRRHQYLGIGKIRYSVVVDLSYHTCRIVLSCFFASRHLVYSCDRFPYLLIKLDPDPNADYLAGVADQAKLYGSRSDTCRSLPFFYDVMRNEQ